MFKPVAGRLAAVLAITVLSAPWAFAGPEVIYSLSPRLDRDTLTAVSVRIEFDGDPDGETILELPNEWGGEVALWRSIRDLSVAGDGAILAAGADSAERTIRHAPGTPLVVTYDIVQESPGEPKAGQGNPYRPIVQPGYFHLIGDAIFAVPDRSQETPARFKPVVLPAGWNFASDLEHARPDHPLSLGDIVESVSVGGDFRVIKRPEDGSGLRVALRGRWPFTDDGLADKISHIVTSHLRFWGDPDEPFVVTVLPLISEGGGSSLGGTGRSDAFAFFATDNGQEATINRILAHEHLHTWIPRRIGVMPDSNEASDYWLSEGFTDFYTFRLLVRDGPWSVDDYMEATNEVLQRYAQSPVRLEPNERIVRDFWNDHDVQDLPYQRGFLLAMIWDAKLRSASEGRKDLDDVMRAMKTEYLASIRDSVPAAESFIREMTEAGIDPRGDLKKFMERGEAIVLPKDLLEPWAVVETAEIPEFTRGFDPVATTAADGVVSGVDPDGPAWTAGLRDGMKILKREAGKPGDSRVELVYLVEVDGQERRIRYLPEGKRRFVTQRIQPGASLDAPGKEDLRRRIGGE